MLVSILWLAAIWWAAGSLYTTAVFTYTFWRQLVIPRSRSAWLYTAASLIVLLVLVWPLTARVSGEHYYYRRGNRGNRGK